MKSVKSEQLPVNSEQVTGCREPLTVNREPWENEPESLIQNRQSSIQNRQSSIFNRQSSIFNRRGSMWVLVFLLAVALFMPASDTLAQNYWFQVPQLRMQIFIEPDASARIVYDITFDNSGSAIDIVDIGTPHDGYDLSNFTASIDGQPLTGIYKSEYIDTGVEIHLNEYAIQSGESGTLHVEFTMPDMVYEDTTRDGYASFQITPTWFDSSVVYGSSDIWVLVHMLPEVQPDEVLFQDVEFTDKAIYEEHTVVGWHYPTSSAAEPHLAGTSFPTTGMTRVIEQSLLDITAKWLQDNPSTAIFLGIVTLVLVGVAFFRFSGGTGFSVFAIIGGGLIFGMWLVPLLILLALPLSILLVALVEFRLKKKKRAYLPAIAQVEGGGIKRGLTAPEAAVLLELPLNKVLLLIMFGLLDKRVITLLDDSPLLVKVDEAYVVIDKTDSKKRHERRAAASGEGVVLRSYEHSIIDVLQDNPGKPVHKQDFGEPMRALVKSVAAKMKGFDLSDTQDYYKKIISRAMDEAKRMGDVPEFEKFLDKTWPWVMMADDYAPVFQRRGYTYHPTWVRPYVLSQAGSSGGASIPAAGGTSGPSYGGKTSFANVAASFAGWTETQTGNLASAISPGGLDLGTAGVVNLSGADKVTGDIFKALSSGSGGSGGSSGGGCACACAGCACACACAGGGR